MKKVTQLLASLVCIALCGTSAHALYWDGNGATAGAGTAPGGAWTDAKWSTSEFGTVATGAWTPGETAVFSAGTDATGTYTVSGNATVGGINVEEGKVAFSGTVTLGAGDITISSGATLSINSSVRISATAGSVITINGGTMEDTNPSTAGSFVDVDQTIVLGTGGGTLSYTVAGLLNIVQTTTVISGTGPLVKEGAGILAIASPCTYSGKTIINNGKLRSRGGTNRFPTGTDVEIATGASFDPASTGGNSSTVRSVSGSGDVTFSASGTLVVNLPSGTKTLSGAITDGTSAGLVEKKGSGTWELNGVNTFNGTFTQTAGTTTVNSGATPGAKLADPDIYLVVNGGTLNLNNTAQTVYYLIGTGGTVSLGSGHTLSISSADTTARSYTGALAGSGNLIKNTPNTLTLGGASPSFDGNITVSQNTITVTSADALGSAVGKTTVPAGSGLNFNSATTFTINEPVEIAGTGNTVATGGAISVSTAATAITFGGTITLTDHARVGVSSGAGTTGIFSGSPAFAATDKNLTLYGASGTGTKQVSGAINLGSGTLIKESSGTWILSAGNSYSGGTTISSGGLNAQVAGSLGSGNVTVSSTAVQALTLGNAAAMNSSANLILPAAPVAGAVSLNFVGTQTINALQFGAVWKAAGTWGAPGSAATYQDPALTGSGLLLVSTKPAGGNNDPVAPAAKSQSTPKNTASTFDKVKLLAGASDPDGGDVLSVSSVISSSAQGGTVVLQTDDVKYTPATGFTGSDTYYYMIGDGNGGRALATVNVTVSDGLSPNLVSVNHDGTGFTVVFAGVPGVEYTIESSPMPSPGYTWTKFGANITADLANGSITVIDSPAPNDGRVYRTVWPSYP